MNSLSEPAQSANYEAMEYREAGAPCDSTDSQESSSESSCNTPPTSRPAEQQSDPAALFTARLEEERRAITAQARQEAEHEIQRARGEIAHTIELFAKQRDDYFRQAEGEVVSLALAIARRILHREAQIDQRLLAGLVNYELDQLDAATKVRLFVSTDALGYWNDAAPTMSRQAEVIADKLLRPGEARIETDLGSSTVNVEHELKEIERGFFDLLSQRPAATDTTSVRVQ